MKRTCVFSVFLLCTALLLGSCSRDTAPQNGDQETPENREEMEATTPDGEKVAAGLTFDFATNTLILLDYITNSVLGKDIFEENSFAGEIFKLDQGYAVEVRHGNEPVHKAAGEVIILPETTNNRMLRIYNDDLALQQEIDLADILPEELPGVITVSEDGNKIAWTNFGELYLYDVVADKTSKILAESSDALIFEKIRFTRDNNRIVFYGQKPEDGEKDLSYGLIDLETKEITVHTEAGYKQGNDIHISNRYACFTDSVQPLTNSSSGKVLLLDLQSKETFSFPVDGTESTIVRVTEDENYLLTVKEETDGSYLIRQYGLKSGDVVQEKTFKPEGDSRVVSITAADAPFTYYVVVLTEGNKYVCYTFMCEEE